jgi:hypothetical protein
MFACDAGAYQSGLAAQTKLFSSGDVLAPTTRIWGQFDDITGRV